MKTCVGCGFTSFYPEEHFYKAKTNVGGLAPICTACDARRKTGQGGNIRKIKGFGYLNQGMTLTNGILPSAARAGWRVQGLKTCSKCKVEKSADTVEFYSDSRRGLSSHCKKCQRAAKSARRKTPPIFRDGASKQCPCCRQVKPFSDYYRAAAQKDGLYCYCKPCQNKKGREYNERNRDKARVRENRRKDSDPGYLMKCRILGLIRKSLDRRAGKAKVKSVTSSFWPAIGYSSEQLALHIERQFLPGMTWENRREWHIDHIMPIKSFSYESFECQGFQACWALSNLRPIWALDNLRKGIKETFLL